MENGGIKKIMKWLSIGLLAVFLGFIFACIFYIFYLVKTGEWKNGQPASEKLNNSTIDENKLKGITKDNYWFGSSKPKVTIIEFGDFSCAQCKEAFPTVREIVSTYKETKIIFKDYPVISTDSANLASAGRCAGEQGFFWPMYDKLFLNQGVTQRQDLIELAKQVGADTERFANCFDNKKYEAKIKQDFQDGNDLNISGTPTWIINGYKIEGAPPREAFIGIIDELLKK